MKPYPTNGYELLKLRMEGKRPDAPVLVRFFCTKDANLPNPILTVEQGINPDELDWSMLHDLNVIVIARYSIPSEVLFAALRQIINAEPAFLALYNANDQAAKTLMLDGEIYLEDWDAEDNRQFTEELRHA